MKCKDCQEQKQVTAFRKLPSGNRRSRCRKCDKAHQSEKKQREWRQRDLGSPKYLARLARFKAKHPNANKQSVQRYVQRHPERSRRLKREWKWRNPDRQARIFLKYMSKHPARLYASMSSVVPFETAASVLVAPVLNPFEMLVFKERFLELAA